MTKEEFLASPCVDNADLGNHAVSVFGDKPGEVRLSALYPDGIVLCLMTDVLTEVYGKCNALRAVGPKAAGYWLDERRNEVEAENKARSEAEKADCCRDEELNSLLLPLAQLKGDVVTRDMVLLMAEKYKKGPAAKVCEKALSDGAKWFKVEYDAEWGKPKSLWPITSVFVAKSCGIRPFKIPVMPKHYRNKGLSRVVGHKFTYETLYRAWKRMLEKIISRRDKETLKLPFYLTVTVYDGDTENDNLDSVTDFAGLVKAVERSTGNVTVDVMWNDPWGEMSEPTFDGLSITADRIY